MAGSLPGDTKDDIVTLIALGYASNDDLDAAQQRLKQLDAPNLAQLVAGVIERRAQAGDSAANLSALSSLAVGMGVQPDQVSPRSWQMARSTYAAARAPIIPLWGH